MYDTMIINNIKDFFYWLRDRGFKNIDIKNLSFTKLEELAKKYVEETYGDTT